MTSSLTVDSLTHLDLLQMRLLGPRLVVALLALAALSSGAVLVLLRRRRSRRLGWVAAVLAAVLVVATVGAAANTAYGAYPTVADLLGVPRYPSPTSIQEEDDVENGALAEIQVPDTASHFGLFRAQVWLPPQYFTQPTTRFPVAILTHGNPGHSTDWLDAGAAAETGLTSARAGRPVILVFPTVLQEPDGDSLCVDTALEGHAETYVVQDVVAAVDQQLRTRADAAHRTLGGFSMGGFCALNLGLKHPDVFSVALAFSALTVCEPDAIAGGNEELFDSPDWQEQATANSPADYVDHLEASDGPAVWLDAGESESTIVGPMTELGEELSARGFTVQVHTRPGGHDFGTWTDALQAALPWAAARMAAATP